MASLKAQGSLYSINNAVCQQIAKLQRNI